MQSSGCSPSGVSKTDAFKLGINPPLRDSGDLEDSAVVSIIGPKGIITKPCCIIARRHIHVTPSIKKEYNLPDVVSVRVDGIRGGVIGEVYVKVSDEAYYEMHIDTDDANANFVKNGDIATIIGVENEK